MRFNRHSDFEGQHAFLSASNYHWVNYDEAKLRDVYLKRLAVQRGSELHDLARRLIELGVPLPKNKRTLNNYVNDALTYRMTPEQVLFYSENCFGTADTICFRNNLLRIHDLKTGETPANMLQLEIYAALFCLEYNFKPGDIDMQLRIYQSDEIQTLKPEPRDIYDLMGKITKFDIQIKNMKDEFGVYALNAD